MTLIAALLYNMLIQRKNRVESVASTVDIMLKKRFDLIPNLVQSVKGYMQHERELLEEISKLRAHGRSSAEMIRLDQQTSGLLGRLMVAVENYPELKADQHFLHLQKSLTEMEEQISAARRAYNAAVIEFNNAVEMFPTNILASMMKYRTKPFFQIEAVERQNIQIKVDQ